MPYETRCKMGRTSAKVRATKSRRNFSQRMHLIHPIGPKTDVLVRFVLFGCIRNHLVALQNSVQNGTVWLPYETRCKTGRTSAKVRAMQSHRNFSQRTLQIHPVGPKLTFWCVLYYLGAFETVWLSYKTRGKTGRTSAKVRVTKSRRNFSPRNTRSNPLGPKLTF